jgi:hypothetical protein
VASDPALPENAVAVLAYFVEHPHIEDTIDGLVTWWLLDRQLASARLEMRLIVSELLARGLMDERVATDGSTRYGMAHARLDEARVIIAGTRGA